MAEQAQNTDIELWRGPDEGNGSYYADSVHVTAGGGIGINAGGCVAVRTPKLWHDEIGRRERAEEELECAHMALDDMGAPRMRDDERLSLVGRINWISKGRCD